MILLTAKTDQDSKILGGKAGADVYLGKPFNEEELSSSVKNLLTLKAREKEVETLNHYITESVLKRYLPPKLVQDILDNKVSMDTPARAMQLTILFSDLSGFTALAERLDRHGRLLRGSQADWQGGCRLLMPTPGFCASF